MALDRQGLIDLYLHAYMQAKPGSDMEETYLLVTTLLVSGYDLDICTGILEQRITLAKKKKGLQQ